MLQWKRQICIYLLNYFNLNLNLHALIKLGWFRLVLKTHRRPHILVHAADVFSLNELELWNHQLRGTDKVSICCTNGDVCSLNFIN